MSHHQDSSDRAARLKGGFAIAIIVVCLGYVVWSFWPKAPIALDAPDDAYTKWSASWGEANSEHAARKDATYWILGKVTARPTDDRTGVVIAGKVATQAELASVKAVVEKVQPPLPVTWQVTVGG